MTVFVERVDSLFFFFFFLVFSGFLFPFLMWLRHLWMRFFLFRVVSVLWGMNVRCDVKYSDGSKLDIGAHSSGGTKHGHLSWSEGAHFKFTSGSFHLD